MAGGGDRFFVQKHETSLSHSIPSLEIGTSIACDLGCVSIRVLGYP